MLSVPRLCSFRVVTDFAVLNGKESCLEGADYKLSGESFKRRSILFGRVARRLQNDKAE